MTTRIVDEARATAFLAGERLAVVGACSDERSMAKGIIKALETHGIDVVRVERDADDGEGLYASLGAVPGRLDGVIAVVDGDSAVELIEECGRLGIGPVWLFQGIGQRGAASDEALAAAARLGVEVIPGACPLMFLEPVRGVHRFHRFLRRRRHELVRAA